ncbi:polysaccharide biosynthesis/export family protein [Mesorhizobium sp. VK24D]|uniref:Polysaccharide biosynthesis/export family protein n=1 Tax=Mesorhizobium album TaxID=3072314 RepID=A0ABU4Y116_9HYPH|nr:polysaccharide biosynthesis/export family protein [Mesorhizobium sp. VK24D]MDX8480644.1 polysaccharide biosynthesis/export family protein [Mesorhizobium sp. VK24D]
MNHVQGTQTTCLHRDFTFIERWFLRLLHGMRGRGRALLCLISLSVVLLLGFPAKSQSTADDKLAPRDTIELRVWHWTALRNGVVEGLQLNRTFSIDSTGKLDLPNIGSIAAAGLRTDELAKLIADRLQARSGLPERPDTIVQRIQQPTVETTGSVEPTGNQTTPEPSALVAANGSSSPAAPERADIEKEPGAAQPSGPAPPTSGEQKVRVPQAPDQSAQTLPGEHEEALRRELAASRAALDVMQRNAGDASARARAAADSAAKQGEALKEQQRVAEALARDLQAARRVIEGLKAKAILWDGEKTALLGAQHSMEASQAGAKRALDAERHRVELLEQELTKSHQTIDALKTGANLAAVGRADAIKGRQVAEAALTQAGDALTQERERADSAIRDLDSVRKERDASKQVSIELSAALEQERERATGLARSLSAARGTTDIVKAHGGRRTVGLKRAPKVRIPASPLASAAGRSGAQHARKPGSPDKQRSKIQNPPQPDPMATEIIVLPAELLPTQPPELDPSE